jgi:hypothetical protein
MLKPEVAQSKVRECTGSDSSSGPEDNVYGKNKGRIKPTSISSILVTFLNISSGSKGTKSNIY